jgi:hypothetical protein
VTCGLIATSFICKWLLTCFIPKRNRRARILSRPDVVLFEGIFVLYEKRIRESLSMKLFVDVDSDVRLAQRGTYIKIISAQISFGEHWHTKLFFPSGSRYRTPVSIFARTCAESIFTVCEAGVWGFCCAGEPAHSFVIFSLHITYWKFSYRNV